MYRLIPTVLEVLASAVVLIPMYGIWNRAYFHDFRKSVVYCVFSFYLAAVYILVGMPNITYFRFEVKLNLLPVVGMIDDWKNSILNVLLFVPLGMMLPIVWQKYRAGKQTVLFGFCLSLAIEILQIFTFRATDVNDLITNTLGTILGFAFANVLMKVAPGIKGWINEKKAGELYLVCAVAFGVMFLVQPFLSAIMWKII